MRIVGTCLLPLALAGCGYLASNGYLAPPMKLDASIVTSGGVRVEYTRCSIPEIVTSTSIRLGNVKLTDSGRVRYDPRFRFDKPGISLGTAEAARGVVEYLSMTFKWACAALERDGPERTAYLTEF